VTRSAELGPVDDKELDLHPRAPPDGGQWPCIIVHPLPVMSVNCFGWLARPARPEPRPHPSCQNHSVHSATASLLVHFIVLT
jgi:hypothetical protein